MNKNGQTSQSAFLPASVDPEERARFDRLAAMWWDETGPMWPLHRLNQFRTGIIIDVIRRQLGQSVEAPKGDSLNGVRLLDIGCGGGILSETMARFGADVHGVDISEKNIAIAAQHAEQQGLKVRYDVTTAEDLAQTGQQYDIVLNMEVVEHVADLQSFMHACNALVKPGGLQFISTINRNPLAWLIAIFGAETVLRWLPKGTHQYRKLVKPKELEALLSDGGFTVVERTGVVVNPFTRSISASALEMVNYMLFAAKPPLTSAARPGGSHNELQQRSDDDSGTC